MSDIVCVTGASGYIGTWVVKALLEQGYRVRGTVRDASDSAKTEQLRAAGDVELFSADLTHDGSFDEAIADCTYVVHAASAVLLTAKDPQREIVDVAVNGTLNVLRSAARAKTVKRVVQTSSIAAVIDGEVGPGHQFTEADWNESATVDTGPYDVSKRQSEREAVKFVEQLSGDERFDIVAINPGFVLGPVLARVHLRSSPSLVRDLLRGTFPLAPRLFFAMVDVRDVADAHVKALTVESPAPRYICTAESHGVPEVARLLRAKFPKSKAPRFKMPDLMMYGVALFDKRLSFGFLRRNLGRQRNLNNALIRKDLGLTFRSMETSIEDTAQSILDGGYA